AEWQGCRGCRLQLGHDRGADRVPLHEHRVSGNRRRADMDISTASAEIGGPVGHGPLHDGPPAEVRIAGLSEQEALRAAGWDIGERRPADSYQPQTSCVGLAMVHPTQGFAFWRLLPSWVDDKARSRGHAWHNSRPILRLYDVSYIEFTGLNAHRM